MSILTGIPINTARYEFLANCLNGTGGFITGDYLVKYARESDAKYLKRKELAWYQNLLRPACTRFVGYLSRKPPKRESNNPLIDKFIDDVDWQGNNIDIFLSEFFTQAKARGAMLLLVEMPQATAKTLEQQLTQRQIPYLIAIPPESIRSYSMNKQGLFEYVEIQTMMQVEGKLQLVIQGWSETQWWVSLNGTIIQGAEHPLGCCPVLGFSEGQFPCFGEFAQIGDLSKRLFNLNSELDEILRSQTFSLLTYQMTEQQAATFDPAKMALEVGTNNTMFYQGTQAPSFAQPATGPAEVYLKTIASIEEKIKGISLAVELSRTAGTGPESGIALAIRFEALNAALSSFSKRAEDLERRLFDVVSRWLKMANTTTVAYSKGYELADITTELTTLASYEAAQMSPEVILAKKQQIINLDFSNMEHEELQALLDSLDVTDPAMPLLEARLAMLEANQPHANSGGLPANDPANDPTQMMGGN